MALSWLGSKRLVFAVAVGLAGMGAACKKTEAPPPPPPAVEVAPVVQKDVPVFQEWIGSLDGFVNAEIRPQIEGYLLRQAYRDGFLVRTGETLFEIDPRQFQATYDQAKGHSGPVRGDARQCEDDGGALPSPGGAEGDQPAGARRRRDEGAHGAGQRGERAGQLEKAKLDLDWTKVVSPIDGIAGVAKSQVGDLVNRLTVMTTVSQVDPIKVNFNPSEQEYLTWVARHGPPEKTLRAGQDLEKGPLELILSDGSVFPHHGRAILVGREVDVKTGTIQLAGAFPNPGNLLRPGPVRQGPRRRGRQEGRAPRPAARRDGAAGQLPGRRRRRGQQGDDQGREGRAARRKPVGHRETG